MASLVVSGGIHAAKDTTCTAGDAMCFRGGAAATPQVLNVIRRSSVPNLSAGAGAQLREEDLILGGQVLIAQQQLFIHVVEERDIVIDRV